MQQTPSKVFHGGGKTVQNALQQLLSRVQSSISDAASVTHLSGRGIRDLEQIAQRGPPLTADDLVSLCVMTAPHYSRFSLTLRSRRLQTL